MPSSLWQTPCFFWIKTVFVVLLSCAAYCAKSKIHSTTANVDERLQLTSNFLHFSWDLLLQSVMPPTRNSYNRQCQEYVSRASHPLCSRGYCDSTLAFLLPPSEVKYSVFPAMKGEQAMDGRQCTRVVYGRVYGHPDGTSFLRGCHSPLLILLSAVRSLDKSHICRISRSA
ncbi:hypothetical protein BJ165DRAFT_1103297 [Panaeolus papilionaceus]|nr:hypothetical protein BJ165DRAFT_1103297 [Panaeolus papilionaceus]